MEASRVEVRVARAVTTAVEVKVEAVAAETAGTGAAARVVVREA